MGVDALTELTDAGLVVAISRYRQEALAEAYRRHAGAVFGLARRLLGDTPGPRRSSRRSSSGCGTGPRSSTRGGARCAAFLLAQCHGRSVDLLRSDRARRRREERDLRRTAEAGYDVEHEVWDLTVAERMRDALAVAARGRAPGHRARLLRRPQLPRGGRAARRARGYGQEPHPRRPAAAAHAARRRRPRRRRGAGDDAPPRRGRGAPRRLRPRRRRRPTSATPSRPTSPSAPAAGPRSTPTARSPPTSPAAAPRRPSRSGTASPPPSTATRRRPCASWSTGRRAGTVPVAGSRWGACAARGRGRGRRRRRRRRRPLGDDDATAAIWTRRRSPPSSRPTRRWPSSSTTTARSSPAPPCCPTAPATCWPAAARPRRRHLPAVGQRRRHRRLARGARTGARDRRLPRRPTRTTC